VSDDRRRQLGQRDGPLEDALEESFDQVVGEGAARLNRRLLVVLVTGFFGGLEVGLGVLAYLAVLHQTHDHLLAGLAFGVGFVALLLAHSELFTENFLMPVAAVVAREGTLLQLGRLWVGTLAANLVGGWLFMWLVVLGFPEWRATITEAGATYATAPLEVRTAVLAVLAGSTITLMTRMQQGTDSVPAKIVAAMIGGLLLAGLGLFHSVLDSLLIFGAIDAGAGVGYLDWLRWFGYTLVGNLVGGLLLVTALRLVRTGELVRERRRTPPSASDAGR
jgi:formate-nitrite transporter family protein